MTEEISIVVTEPDDVPAPQLGAKSDMDIALEVIEGKWGGGHGRRQRLLDAGYNHDAIRDAVVKLIGEKRSKKQR